MVRARVRVAVRERERARAGAKDGVSLREEQGRRSPKRRKWSRRKSRSTATVASISASGGG
jgi:hypothetical protein